MIPFFRKIRYRLAEDKQFFKYSRYAIGEIVLVVIGILIALQINNWNNQEIEKKQIRSYLVSLAEDLKSDLRMTDTVLMQGTKIVNRIEKLNEYVRNKDIQDISNIEMLCFSWIKSNRPYVWNRSTLEELKSSGLLSNIKNQKLKGLISDYDAFTHHMDLDFSNDKVLFDKASDLMLNVVNYNYPNINEIDKLLLDPKNPTVENDFYDSEEYKKAEKLRLKLVAKNIDDIKIGVNAYIRLKSNLKIRTEVELPKLRNDAQFIIDQITKLYTVEKE